jgi:phosphatidylserine synthase
MFNSWGKVAVNMFSNIKVAKFKKSNINILFRLPYKITIIISIATKAK